MMQEAGGRKSLSQRPTNTIRHGMMLDAVAKSRRWRIERPGRAANISEKEAAARMADLVPSLSVPIMKKEGEWRYGSLIPPPLNTARHPQQAQSLPRLDRSESNKGQLKGLISGFKIWGTSPEL